MLRSLPFLIGLVLLLGGGAVHGLWTHRWQASEELVEAAERLHALPNDIGAWKGEVYEHDPEDLKMAGAVSHWSREFTDSLSGEKVLVMLLCGKAARLVVHRPEHCYGGAGFEITAPAQRVQLTPLGSSPAWFWTGLFNRDDVKGQTQLRIFWAWSGGDKWEAPDSPRIAFARYGALYKLYVVRVVTKQLRPGDDPAAGLMAQLLPILDDALGQRGR
jgi:hypothetical protein